MAVNGVKDTGLIGLNTRRLITDRPVRSAAMPVLHLLSGPKVFFRPTGATYCPDKRDIWPFYRDRNVGIQPSKLSKFRISDINLSFSSDSFAQFLRIFHPLYASLGRFFIFF